MDHSNCLIKVGLTWIQLIRFFLLVFMEIIDSLAPHAWPGNGIMGILELIFDNHVLLFFFL